MTKLTEHFSLEEMYHSDTANAKKINNKPNAQETEHLKELCEKILEPLRVKIGLPIKVNSGYRGPKLNAAIPGSSKTSAHQYGYAADIVCPAYGNAKEFCKYVVKFLNDNKIAFDQVLYEYDSWVHVGIRNGKGLQRKQVITINKKGKFTGIV